MMRWSKAQRGLIPKVLDNESGSRNHQFVGISISETMFGILLQRRLRSGVVTAFVTVGIGIAVSVAFPACFRDFPFLTVFPAVLMTAFVGGWRPALVAAVAALLFSWFYLIPPEGFELTPSAAIGLAGAGLFVAIEIGLIEIVGIAARRLHANQLQSRALVTERDARMSELQHRVANNMQFVASLLTLQSRALPVGTPGRAALQKGVDRLVVFSAIHRKLQDTQRAENGFAGMVEEILSDLLAATDCSHVALQVEAEPVPLRLDTVTTLVLITTEAATNSIKHVFSRSRGTRLEVVLKRVAADEVELAIADDGPGLPQQVSSSGQGSPAHGAKTGQGLGILQSLAAQVGGKLSLEASHGVVVRLRFPAPPSPEETPVSERPWRHSVQDNHFEDTCSVAHSS
jgi:two-component sensor histidine kinase